LKQPNAINCAMLSFFMVIIDATMTELNEFREQNKLLAHEKWILGQEKALCNFNC